MSPRKSKTLALRRHIADRQHPRIDAFLIICKHRICRQLLTSCCNQDISFRSVEIFYGFPDVLYIDTVLGLIPLSDQPQIRNTAAFTGGSQIMGYFTGIRVGCVDYVRRLISVHKPPHLLLVHPFMSYGNRRFFRKQTFPICSCNTDMYPDASPGQILR